MSGSRFGAAYAHADTYASVLLPHRFDGDDDIDLVRRVLRDGLGNAPVLPDRRVLELGCGAGRVTSALAPYAKYLHGVDSSPGMLARFRQRFPGQRTTCADAGEALARLTRDGSTFDLVGAFWSLNYPLLACFEVTSARGVVRSVDQAAALRRARQLVADLLSVVVPGGHLVVLFFDARTAEQELVTRLWERIAPFPASGRELTWRLLHEALIDAEATGRGVLTHTRLPGFATASGPVEARRWFTEMHLNGFGPLVDDPDVIAEIDAFVADRVRPDGQVRIPSGVHVVHYVAARMAETPPGRPG